MNIGHIIRLVKQKRELRGVADTFIASLLEKERKRHTFPENLSEKECKILIKDIRAQLRRYVGRFQRPAKRDTPELEQHISTHERTAHYAWLRSQIAHLSPRSILDMGCGLNPIKLADSSVIYCACDINETDLARVQEHFRKRNIKGEVFVADVTTPIDLPYADLVLALKLFDILDERGHANVERILKNLHCKHIIASFPTRKLSGRRMNRPRRAWFEKLLIRLKLSYTKTELDNELFYIISKQA